MSLNCIDKSNYVSKLFRNTLIKIIIILFISSNLNQISCYKTEDFLVEPELNRELLSRMNYYNSLINDLKLNENVSLEVKNNRIYLKALQDNAAFDNQIILPKFMFFTSCDIFPFKDIIINTLNNISKESKIDLNKFSSNLMVVYSMMYYKYADKEKAKKYYIELYKDDQEQASAIQSILPFEVHPEIKLYLENLPQKNNRSLFFFNDEEIQLAKDLGIELITKALFENTHKNIIEFMKKNLPEDLSKIILEFLDRQDDFNSIISLLNSSEIFMEEKVFMSNFLAPNKVGYYTEFKQKHIPINSPLRSVCRYIAPLVDLIDIRAMKNLDKSDGCSVLLERVTENQNYVYVTFNKRIYEGENFYHTSTDLMQSELLFSLTGNVVRDNPTDFVYLLHPIKKEDFSKETIDLCHQAGCGGMNLNYIFSVNPKDTKIPLFAFKNNLNYDALKIFKLKFFKIDYYNKQNYLNDKYIDYATEIKADIEYLNSIQIQQQVLPDYEKLLEDYLKLRGIYKGMNNFNQANLVKIFSGLENKINMVEVALIKGEIIKKHEDLILKKMVKDVQEDVKRLKLQYLS